MRIGKLNRRECKRYGGSGKRRCPISDFQKFHPFTEHLAKKVHNLGVDALKLLLTNTLPVPANGVKADIAEIAAGGGYTAGGLPAVIVSAAQVSGVFKLVLDDIVITAAGGSIGPFNAVVLYNSTAAAGNLIGWWGYGSSITLNTAETFTVDYDQAAGVLTIT